MLDWDKDVRPVILAIYRAMESHPSDHPAARAMGPMTDSAGINAELGRDGVDRGIWPVLITLNAEGYLGDKAYGNPQTGEWLFVRLGEKGLQVAAGWPAQPGDDTYAALLAVLDQLIAQSSNPDERTRLEKLRDGVAGVGRDVVTDVLSKVATGGL